MNETTMNSNPANNPGKGLGVGGFVIALVSIVGYFVVAGIAALQAVATGGGTGTMIMWSVICALGLLLSFMGYRKSSAVGMKNGIAIAGIVIGAVALILSVWTMIGLKAAAEDPEMQKARQELKDAMNDGLNKMEKDIDNMQDTLNDTH